MMRKNKKSTLRIRTQLGRAQKPPSCDGDIAATFALAVQTLAQAYPTVDLP